MLHTLNNWMLTLPKATWRLPIGESGLLAFFSSIAPTAGLRQALRIHSLRLIGNSCADTGT